MEANSYIKKRLDALIAEGENILGTYNQFGNIDKHDLWFTEAKNFLSVNAPDYIDKLHSIAPKYHEQLLEEAYGRAAYNLIQYRNSWKFSNLPEGSYPSSNCLNRFMKKESQLIVLSMHWK